MTEPNPSAPLSEMPEIASRSKRQHWRRIGFWSLGTVLIGGVAFSLGLAWWLQNRLSPLIARELSHFLNRPVEIGDLQFFSFDYLRFGASEVAATDSDPDRLQMAALGINYDPVGYLLTRRLKVEVTAINGSLLLEEGQKGQWLRTPVKSLAPDHPINLVRLHLQNIETTLKTRSPTGQLRSAVNIRVKRGKAQFDWRKSRVEYDLAGKVARTGQLNLQGSGNFRNHTLAVQIDGKQIPAQVVARIVTLPLTLERGTLDSRLAISWQQGGTPQVLGTATLDQVTAAFKQLPRPLTQAQGLIRFESDRIELERVKAYYGKVWGIAQGSIFPDKGLRLQANIPATPIPQILSTLNLPVSIPLQGSLKSQIYLEGAFHNPRLTVDLVAPRPIEIDRVPVRSLNAQLALQGSQLSVYRLTAVPEAGGIVTGGGKVAFDRQKSLYSLNFQTQGLPLAVANRYRPDLPLATLTSQGQMTGDLRQFQTSQLLGSGQVDLNHNRLKIDDFRLKGDRWQGTLSFNDLSPKVLPISLPKALDRSRLNGTFQVWGDRRNLSLNQLQARGNAQLSLAGGSIQSKNLYLDSGRWRGNFQAKQWAIASFLPDLPRSLAGDFDGSFDLSGDLSPNFQHITGKGKGYIDLVQGAIAVRQLQIGQGRWSGVFNAQNLALKPFLPHAQTSDRLAGQLTLAGQIAKTHPTLTGSGSANLSLGQGAIAIPQVKFDARQASATLILQNIALAPFSRELRGNTSGRIQVTMPLLTPAQLNPAQIQTSGKVTISEGLGAINRPIEADFDWNGQRLALNSVSATDLIAKGWIDLTFRDRRPQIQTLNLAIKAQNFPLQALTLPNFPKETRGKLDFEGNLAGNTNHPQINGKIALLQLQSPALPLALESVMTGQITTTSNGEITLNLAGKTDKIALSLDNRYQPSALDLQLPQISIKGRQQQNQLLFEIDHLPLSLLQAIAQANPQLISASLSQSLVKRPLNGDLSGKIWLNLPLKSIFTENLTIIQPQWGTFQGDRLTGDFRYANGQFALKDAQLRIKQSLYSLTVSREIVAGKNQWQGDIKIEKGEIQDILAALQIYELDDLKRGLKAPSYAKTSDLYGDSPPQTSSSPLYSVGLPQGSLGDRLNHFYEHLAFLDRQRQQQQQRPTLPPIAELQGQFKGSIQFSHSPETGLASSFALQGDRWHWGTYPPLALTLQGAWQKETLTLAPFSLSMGEAQVSFQGKLGGNSQQGQLNIVNLPLQPISEAIAPIAAISFGGWLNSTLLLGGNRFNPLAQGQWTIDRPTLNQTPLNPIQGQFTYGNSRLDFAARNPAQNSLRIEGTIPLRLPFATAIPPSDRLALRLSLRDREMSLLNALSKGKITWIGGKGELELDILGRIDLENSQILELKAQGLTKIQQATLATSLMPMPLTQVQGKILFNLDHLDVENLTGRLNGGNVTISGSLPILQPITQAQTQSHPLQVSFDNLLLDLKGIYQGGAKGDLQIMGSVIEPEIAGKIDLFKGQILLGDTFKDSNKDSQTSESFTPNGEFDNFELVLGEAIQVTRLPILNFGARGNLLLNGPLGQPTAEGIIYLRGGQINLFASQLRLVGDAENTAQFSAKWGLDPYLNLRLGAAVNDLNPNTVRTPPLSSEINEPFTANNESLQTVRIQAQVTGLASQLTQGGIDLTSTPRRSRREIITLLGGGFVDTLGRGDTALGLVNLANSAVFGPVQGAIGDALGLGEFRIFPTPLLDERDRLRSDQIGVAAEAGIDITPDLALSILKIINSDRAPQIGIRYRINDHTRLRGSSNFSDDSRAIIEYERRF